MVTIKIEAYSLEGAEDIAAAINNNSNVNVHVSHDTSGNPDSPWGVVIEVE